MEEKNVNEAPVVDAEPAGETKEAPKVSEESVKEFFTICKTKEEVEAFFKGVNFVMNTVSQNTQKVMHDFYTFQTEITARAIEDGILPQPEEKNDM